jgi:hypothetical protein
VNSVLFGILIEDGKAYPADELVEDIDSAAQGGKWSWVLWERNSTIFGIIKAELSLKGRISQLDDVEVISLGEALEESEDSRSTWIIPAKSATGSVQELAQRKILTFIADIYGGKPVDDAVKIDVKPKKVVLAPISPRKRFSGAPKGPGAPVSQSVIAPSTSVTEPAKAAPAAPVEVAQVARKSRRNG